MYGFMYGGKAFATCQSQSRVCPSMARGWSVREVLLGPPELGPWVKGGITLACMSGTALLGFYVQQRLIETYYSGHQAEIHQRVKKIKQREMQQIAALGGEDAVAAVPNIPRGEGALLRLGGRRDGGKD